MKLKIYNLTWDVIPVEKDNAKLEDCCGLTIKDEGNIYICKSLKKDLLKRTIIHEITHAFIWSYGFENISCRKFEEEDICNIFESYGELILKMSNEVYNKIIKGGK